LEHTKDARGHNIHISHDEMKSTARTLGYIGAGLVLIRLFRFLVWK